MHKLKIKRIQETVCRLLCNKVEISYIATEDISHESIFESRKELLEILGNSYLEQSHLSELDEERKKQLLKEVAIYDLLKKLKLD